MLPLPPPWLPFSNNSRLSDPSAGAHPTQPSCYPPPSLWSYEKRIALPPLCYDDRCYLNLPGSLGDVFLLRMDSAPHFLFLHIPFHHTSNFSITVSRLGKA